jgi:hypothetical protein
MGDEGRERHLAREGPVGALDLLQRGVAAYVQRGVVVLPSALGRRRRCCGRTPPERGGEKGSSAGSAREYAGTEVELAGSARARRAEGRCGARGRVWVRGEEKHGGHGTGRWLPRNRN